MAGAGVSIGRKLRRLPHSALLSRFRPVIQYCSLGSSVSQLREEEKWRWKRWFLFVPGALTFGLGTWQVFRRQDKIKLLEYRGNRLEMEPIKWNRTYESQKNKDSLDFRRVKCRGSFEESKSIYIGPRSRTISGVLEHGYILITPLIPISGDPESVPTPVLINRGWVPRSWAVKESRDESHTHSIQKSEARPPWWKFWSGNTEKMERCEGNAVVVDEVCGVIRGGENPNMFVPENDPGSSQWFYVDVDAIGHACGLSGDVLYAEEVNVCEDPTHPYPLSKNPKDLISCSLMPADHLNYCATWYSLSAAVTYMAFRRVVLKKKLRK